MGKEIASVLFGVFIASTPVTITYTSPIVHEELVAIEPGDINGWTKHTDPLFERIAYCESFDKALGRNNLEAQNSTTTAGGEFQFLDGTWKYYGQKLWGDEWVNKNKKSTDNRELAWYVYTHYGTSDWEADPKSYNCWKGEIPNAIYKNYSKLK